MLFLMVPVLSILAFTAWACVSRWGLTGPGNAGPHGFSEMLYAFLSGAGNNGSAFAGPSGNTPWYNTTLGFAMLAGRFLMLLPVLALAGRLARKQVVPPAAAVFRDNNVSDRISDYKTSVGGLQ